jgi:hypothetical protein
MSDFERKLRRQAARSQALPVYVAIGSEQHKLAVIELCIREAREQGCVCDVTLEYLGEALDDVGGGPVVQISHDSWCPWLRARAA